MTLPLGYPVGDTSSYNAPLHSGLPAALIPQFLHPLLFTRCNYLPQTAQVPFVAANNYPQTAQPPQNRGFEDLVTQRARADLSAALRRGGRGQQ
jgi:hypothetical protein